MSRRRPPTSRPRRADAGPPTATPLGLRGWARVAALYGLLLAAVYAPVVFGGRTLAPEAYQPYGMTEHGAWQAPPRTPGYAFMADLGTPAYYEAPVNRVVGARWRRGEVPLWSPWQGLGAPLVAQYSSRALFPYQVLEDLAPSTWADAFLLGRLWIAALCTFGFVRRLVARDDVALAGGALYALSGSLVWFVNLEQMANVAMTVPAFFWACEILAETPSRRAVVVAGAVTALMLLGGQPETAVVALLAGALWTILRAWRRGSLRAGLVAGSASAALGALLSAPLLLPFASFVPRSFQIHDAGRIAQLPPTPWAMAVQIFTPTWFERAARPVAVPSVGHWDWVGGSTGAVPWVLCALVLARWRFRLRAEAALLAGTSAVLVLKNLGVEPFVRLVHLPLLDRVFTNRWAGPVWCFTLAASAALCLDALASPDAQRTARWHPRARWLRHAPALALAAGALLVASFYREALRVEAFAGIDHTYVPTEFARSAYVFAHRIVAGTLTALAAACTVLLARAPKPARPVASVLAALAVAELWMGVPLGLHPSWAAARVAGPACCVAAAAALWLGWARAASLAMAAGAIAGFAVERASPRGLPSARDAYRPAPFVAFLRSHAGHARVMGADGVLVPNLAGVFGLRDVRYLFALAPDAMLRATRRTLNWSEVPRDGDLWFTGASALWAPEPPALVPITARLRAYSLFGVRWIVAPAASGDAPADGTSELRRAYHAEVDVYENPSALPRARVVHAVEPEPADLDEAVRRLDDPHFDGEHVAMVAGAVAVAGPSEPSQADIVTDAEELVEVRTHATAPGLLVLADSWDEDWQATIDGAPAPVLRTNACMRGVAIASGDHTVAFRYRPWSVRVGAWLALAGAAACAWMLRKSARKPG